MPKWFDDMFGNSPQRIDEQIDAFKKTGDGEQGKKSRQGEGFEDIDFILHGQYNALGFNSFYSTYINKSFENELQRLKAYR